MLKQEAIHPSILIRNFKINKATVLLNEDDEDDEDDEDPFDCAVKMRFCPLMMYTYVHYIHVCMCEDWSQIMAFFHLKIHYQNTPMHCFLF